MKQASRWTHIWITNGLIYVRHQSSSEWTQTMQNQGSKTKRSSLVLFGQGSGSVQNVVRVRAAKEAKRTKVLGSCLHLFCWPIKITRISQSPHESQIKKELSQRLTKFLKSHFPFWFLLLKPWTFDSITFSFSLLFFFPFQIYSLCSYVLLPRPWLYFTYFPTLF